MTREETQAVRRMLKDSLWFILPVGGILLIPFLTLLKSGELATVERVIALQRHQPVIAGFAFSYPAPYYKLHSIIERKPEIIALGTSRVMQFREAFFTSAHFFNAGGGINSTRDLLPFLEHIPEEDLPQVILLGLDQNFFSRNWDKHTAINRNWRLSLDAYAGPGNIFLSSWRKVYPMLFQWKIDAAKLLLSAHSPALIGLSAILAKQGFRSDGSYQSEGQSEERSQSSDVAARLTVAFSQLKDKTGIFYSEETADEQALAEVENFLSFAKSRTIDVVGFLPPFAPSVYESAYADPGLKYLPTLAPILSTMFKKYDFDFHDYSNAATVQSTDAEMLDGVHGSEKTYLRLFIDLARDAALAPYVDSEALKEQLTHSVGRFSVFPYP